MGGMAVKEVKQRHLKIFIMQFNAHSYKLAQPLTKEHQIKERSEAQARKHGYRKECK